MALPVSEQEVDTLSHLEDRIQRAVALVNRLRQEKDAAAREVEELKVAVARSEEASARLSRELDDLRDERQQVRNRLEKLLSHIDQLGAA